MTLQQLENNIIHQEELTEEIYKLSKGGKDSKAHQEALRSQINIINNSIPALLEDIEIIKNLPGKQAEKKLVQIAYVKPAIEGEKNAEVTIMKKDEKSFFKHLTVVNYAISQLKKLFSHDEKPSYYIKLSSKLFFDTSNNIVNKGHFKKLNTDLRKANIKLLLNTYISIMFFSTLLAFFIGCLVFAFFLFFRVSLNFPFVIPAAGSFLIRALEAVWIIFALPGLTFLFFYIYPESEAKSIGKKIEQELPFVVINMSAISASGIEPSKIFQIIAKSGEEYPYTKQELEKIINYVSIYGYDTTTALKTAAEKVPSKNLKELFIGLANSITSGTSLTNFLDKRAESLLFNYKLEREQYTKLAETFMNIYISLVIAAPLVLMLTFFLMSLGGLGIGLSLNAISLLIVLVVVLINIFFLIFLHLKQPKY